LDYHKQLTDAHTTHIVQKNHSFYVSQVLHNWRQIWNTRQQQNA